MERVRRGARVLHDSNYSLSPSGQSQHSWGAEVSPAASYFFGQNTPTSLSASAVATMKYFAARPNNDADYTYQGTVALDHKFNENYEGKVSDSVVYAQDPSVLEQGAILTTPSGAQARGRTSARSTTPEKSIFSGSSARSSAANSLTKQLLQLRQQHLRLDPEPD